MVEPVPDDNLGKENDENKIRNPNLAYVFLPARDAFPAKPYNEDGDPSMYTQENMALRDELRENFNVQAAITDFIGKHFSLTGTAQLCSKEEYFKVFMRVGVILRPGMDTDDLAKVIREDFDSDQQPRKRRAKAENGEDDDDVEREAEEEEAEVPKNSDQLTNEQLIDALFELADTWCPSILEDEYVEFFEALSTKMRYSNQHDSSAYDVLN